MLQDLSSSENSYVSTELIPNIYYLSVSHTGLPILFIKHKNNNNYDYELNSVSLSFNKEYVLSLGGETKEQSLSALKLLYVDNEKIDSFLYLISLGVNEFHSSSSSTGPLDIFTKLIELFEQANSPEKSVIQGLWAELYFIYTQDDPDDIIAKWRISDLDLIDFCYNTFVVEVKSTSSRNRIHSFSYNQYVSIINRCGKIVSIWTHPGDDSISVFELQELITKRCKQNFAINKLRNTVAKTLGFSTSTIDDYCFSLGIAEKSTRVIQYSDLVPISGNVIKGCIVDLSLKVDLEKCKMRGTL